MTTFVLLMILVVFIATNIPIYKEFTLDISLKEEPFEKRNLVTVRMLKKDITLDNVMCVATHLIRQTYPRINRNAIPKYLANQVYDVVATIQAETFTKINEDEIE